MSLLIWFIVVALLLLSVWLVRRERCRDRRVSPGTGATLLMAYGTPVGIVGLWGLADLGQPGTTPIEIYGLGAAIGLACGCFALAFGPALSD